MAWTSKGTAISADTGDEVVASSTSTLLEEEGGDKLLRMFGFTGDLVRASVAWPRAETANPGSPGAIEQGTGENIGFVESSRADATSGTAEDLTFVLEDPATTGTYPVVATVIPRVKNGKVLTVRGADGPCTVTYWDAGMVQLPDAGGRLMLLARKATPTSDPYTNDQQLSCAIVGYWAPQDDPTFTGEAVQGPYWLVSRRHWVEGAQVDFWMGVPGGVIADDDGVATLFLYYQVEPSQHPADATATPDHTVWLRKIRLDTLEEIIAGPSVVDLDYNWGLITYGMETDRTELAVSTTLGRGAGAGARLGRLNQLENLRADAQPTMEDVAWTDESTWDDQIGLGLVPGTTVGEVRVWVATGQEFNSDPVDAPNDNTLVEDHFYNVKLADPAPAVCADGTLMLFCSVLEGEGGGTTTSTNYGWGVWRAAAVPATVTSKYGADFVISDSTADNVALSELWPDGSARPNPQYADADPVAVGVQWLVFLGGGDIGGGGGNRPLQRYQGTDDDACRDWTDAWGRSLKAWATPTRRW